MASSTVPELERPTTPPPPLTPKKKRRRLIFRSPTFEDVEDVNTYRRGGNHPVNLGDVIGNRYRVVHKLGNGGFALVWLAWDSEQNQYVALKILKANAPDREVKVLQHLRDVAPNIPVTRLHENFTIDGPNGVHQCLVLDVAGPSLQHVYLYHPDQRPDISLLETASRELARRVADLHAAGICHGDLTHSNILFEIKDIQTWTQDELHCRLGAPKTEPLLLLNGEPAPRSAPAHVVEALDWVKCDMIKSPPSFLMADFGEAFLVNDPPSNLGTPLSFLAPELLFGYAPSCATDLWALGCLLFEIHTRWPLIPVFFCFPGEGLGMAIDTIGRLPESWRGSFREKLPGSEDAQSDPQWWFDENFEPSRRLDVQTRKHLPGFSQAKKAAFVDLLQSLVVFEPSRRIPASAVWDHPFFTKDL